MAPAPVAQPFSFPPEYGTPEEVLAWEPVRDRLEEAPHYWLATVRPDGRPHVMPLDGLWIDDRWFFGGSPSTVKHRNLLENPNVTLHLDDADRAVIVEGACGVIQPDEAFAGELSRRSKEKYGYGPPPSVYMGGVWRLTPRRVLAWQQFPRDATRFVFET
jgi:nitroimidazol reductase NimA-like FMN-containing flavoprotein (pyridoxamine 5'-phosphate oxidase superfamily)